MSDPVTQETHEFVSHEEYNHSRGQCRLGRDPLCHYVSGGMFCGRERTDPIHSPSACPQPPREELCLAKFMDGPVEKVCVRYKHSSDMHMPYMEPASPQPREGEAMKTNPTAVSPTATREAQHLPVESARFVTGADGCASLYVWGVGEPGQRGWASITIDADEDEGDGIVLTWPERPERFTENPTASELAQWMRAVQAWRGKR